MSCYQPSFGGGPYFAVLSRCGFDESRCGFDEHGGTVDCIKTINNATGINELLVRQGGDLAMTSPESFQELEELLEFPSHFSASDLDSRFRDLCAVLQIARDKFSCRVEEDQENPFQELRLQLQKAKDRFHARLAAGEKNSSQRTTHHSRSVTSPLQELRDAFRNARKHFIPLIDQYVNRNDCDADLGGHCHLDGKLHFRPFSIEISSANALDSSTILRANEMNDDSHTRPPEIPPRIINIYHSSMRSTVQGRPAERTAGGTGPTADPPRAGRLEALITKELQRRHEGEVIHRPRSTALSRSSGSRGTGELNSVYHQSLSHGKPADAHAEVDHRVIGNVEMPIVDASVLHKFGATEEDLKTSVAGSMGVAKNRQPPRIGIVPNYSFEPASKDRVFPSK